MSQIELQYLCLILAVHVVTVGSACCFGSVILQRCSLLFQNSWL